MGVRVEHIFLEVVFMLKIRITGTKEQRERLMQLLVELEKQQALTITSQSKEYVNRDQKTAREYIEVEL